MNLCCLTLVSSKELRVSIITSPPILGWEVTQPKIPHLPPYQLASHIINYHKSNRKESKLQNVLLQLTLSLMNLIHSSTAHKAKTHEPEVNFPLIPTLQILIDSGHKEYHSKHVKFTLKQCKTVSQSLMINYYLLVNTLNH